jgi:hypothetical protein
MNIELIVERGSRENIPYVGFVARETEDAVVLVFHGAQRSKPPFFAIKKDRILERHVLRKVQARIPKTAELVEAVA